MRTRRLLLMVSAVMVMFWSSLVGASIQTAEVSEGYDKAIEDYVQFLNKQATTPVDYLIGLFEKYDLVILSTGVMPTESVKELQDVFDVRLNRFGFCRSMSS